MSPSDINYSHPNAKRSPYYPYELLSTPPPRRGSLEWKSSTHEILPKPELKRLRKDVSGRRGYVSSATNS